MNQRDKDQIYLILTILFSMGWVIGLFFSFSKGITYGIFYLVGSMLIATLLVLGAAMSNRK
jgi:hypothetical protein